MSRDGLQIWCPQTAPCAGALTDTVDPLHAARRVLHAGQCGLAVAFGLMRERVTNVLCLDENEVSVCLVPVRTLFHVNYRVLLSSCFFHCRLLRRARLAVAATTRPTSHRYLHPSRNRNRSPGRRVPGPRMHAWSPCAHPST